MSNQDDSDSKPLIYVLMWTGSNRKSNSVSVSVRGRKDCLEHRNTPWCAQVFIFEAVIVFWSAAGLCENVTLKKVICGVFKHNELYFMHK